MIRPTKDGEIFTLENGDKLKAIKLDKSVCDDCCFMGDTGPNCSGSTVEIRCEVWNNTNRNWSHYKFEKVNEESN